MKMDIFMKSGIKSKGLLIVLLLIISLPLVIKITFKNQNQTSSGASSASGATSNTKSDEAEQKLSTVEDSYLLSIPKINISAPVVINVDGNDQKAYDKSLENGVAQLKGTVLPGKPGNSFIFGHSSYYLWEPGDYKEIFKGLDSLNVGDQILVNSNLSHYIYEVTEKKIVLPNNVEVANQNYAEKKLSLMTCWPIGTDSKRLLVISMLKETLPMQSKK